jgi:hypothetical protein
MRGSSNFELQHRSAWCGLIGLEHVVEALSHTLSVHTSRADVASFGAEASPNIIAEPTAHS